MTHGSPFGGAGSDAHEQVAVLGRDDRLRRQQVVVSAAVSWAMNSSGASHSRTACRPNETSRSLIFASSWSSSAVRKGSRIVVPSERLGAHGQRIGQRQVIASAQDVHVGPETGLGQTGELNAHLPLALFGFANLRILLPERPRRSLFLRRRSRKVGISSGAFTGPFLSPARAALAALGRVQGRLGHRDWKGGPSRPDTRTETMMTLLWKVCLTTTV